MIVLWFVGLTLCWCGVRWWDKWLDKKEAEARLARIRERQQYQQSNPRTPSTPRQTP